LTADAETAPSAEGLAKALKPELDKTFKPAFLGRMVIIPFFPVRDENLKQIVRLKLGKVRRRIEESHHVHLAYDDRLVDAVAARCTEVESGARNVDNILTNTLLPEISMRLLEQMATGGGIGTITVGAADDGSLTYHVAAAESNPARGRGGAKEVSAAMASLPPSMSEGETAPVA
jgi:type VI secretion system protein VasG